MTTFARVEERHVYTGGAGWSQRVEIDGAAYFVGVERGKPARIAFKPAGRNKGWHWWGFVRSADGKTLWEGRVGKNLGVPGVLRAAGLLPTQEDTGSPRGEGG